MYRPSPESRPGNCLEPFLGYTTTHRAPKLYHVSGLPDRILQLGIVQGTAQEVREKVVKMRSVWQRLEDYDIFTPKHSTAIGVDILNQSAAFKTTYVLREEVNGLGISDLTPDNITGDTNFQDALTRLPTNLARFFIDTYRQGGDFPHDQPLYMQFVYGNTKSNPQNRMYYVDTEAQFNHAHVTLGKTDDNINLFSSLHSVYYDLIPAIEQLTQIDQSAARTNYRSLIKSLTLPRWRGEFEIDDLRALKRTE